MKRPRSRGPAAASSSTKKALLKRPAAGATSNRRLPKLGKPMHKFHRKMSLEALHQAASQVGFNAKEYLEKGITVLQNSMFTDKELAEALAAARRLRKIYKGGDAGGEFVSLRDESNPDKMLLASLINRYTPFLDQLLNGIKLPFSDRSPYAHHNQIQIALKEPGFEGYDALENMSDPSIGHIDQTASRQKRGKPTSNYSLLLGVVLSGATEKRNDAGNLHVIPKSHAKLAAAFNKFSGPVPWYPDIAPHYLGKEAPPMRAVRAKPGQAILMHHQTVHGVGPNHTSTDRCHIYFRVTSSNRRAGKLVSYPEAMRDPTLETRLLRQLATHR